MSNDRYGIIISQRGIPVARAADYQKVLDSRWKFLEVVHDLFINFTVTVGQFTLTRFTSVEHNLGYFPAFEFVDTSPEAVNIPNTIEAFSTKKNIYFRLSNGDATVVNIRGYLRIYKCDITAEYKAPSEIVAPGSITDTSIGAKALSDAFGIVRMNDDQLQHYSLNTRAKAVSIHQTGTAEATSGNGNKLTFTHNIGYLPTYFIAELLNDNGTDVIGAMTNGFHRAKATPRTIEFLGSQSVLLGKYAALILKDPAEVAQ